jgi:phosphopantetheine--protein transferase-like protein
MVFDMSKKIINAYNALSKNKINSADDVISSEGMSSLVRDRFRSFLVKLGYDWKGETITINGLVSNDSKSIDNYTSVSAKKNSLIEAGIVGIDIQNVNILPDFEDVWLSEFYTTNFSNSEITYCLKLDNPKESFAGIYSAKESIIKASGGDGFFEKSNIVIDHNEVGAPIHQDFFISISHDNDFAVSMAIKKPLLSKDNISEPNEKFNEVKIENEVKKGINLNLLLFIFQLIVLAIFLIPKFIAYLK